MDNSAANFTPPQQPQDQQFPSGTSRSDRNVYIASMPLSMNDKDLAILFSPFGAIETAKAVMDPVRRVCRGYGFVLFESAVSAEAAVRGMNGLVVDGSRLQVRMAHRAAQPNAHATLSFQQRVKEQDEAPARPPPPYCPPPPPPQMMLPPMFVPMGCSQPLQLASFSTDPTLEPLHSTQFQHLQMQQQQQLEYNPYYAPAQQQLQLPQWAPQQYYVSHAPTQQQQLHDPMNSGSSFGGGNSTFGNDSTNMPPNSQVVYILLPQ